MTRSDSNRFENLAMDYVEPMYRLAFSRVGNAEDAQDIVQETYLKAYKSFDSFSNKSSFKNWLTKILINTTHDHFRKKSRAVSTIDTPESVEEECKDSAPSPEVALCEMEIDPAITEALVSIPGQFLMPLLLREIDCASYEEISELLEIPKGTVMSRLSRARKMLRLKLMDKNQVFQTETGT